MGIFTGLRKSGGKLIASFSDGSSSSITSDRVVAVYNLSTASSNISIANNTEEIMDYDDKIIDTHNAVTTGVSWAFTAPRAAYYQVSARVALNSTTAFNVASGEVLALKIFVDSIEVDENFHIVPGDGVISLQPSETVNRVVQVTAGGTIDIRVLQNSGSAINVKTENTKGRCEVSINEL